MPNSAPPAETLLQAAARYLEDELMPTLEGYHRYQTRVTVNVLRMVERELRLGASQDEAGRARLAALLDGHRDVADTAALNLELAAAIRDGRLPIDSPGLVKHLRASLGESLAINNPKWIETEEPT
jgi:hypothetical protein